MSLVIVNTLPRFGIKGRAAADWLIRQGIQVPESSNSWRALGENSRVLRLGRGEFLLEGDIARNVEAIWSEGQQDIYRVPRHDAAFVLQGASTTELMQEICALDTRPQTMGNQVLMTIAAGISVTLVCETHVDVPLYRLWCDATYGDYMQTTLQEILT